MKHTLILICAMTFVSSLWAAPIALTTPRKDGSVSLERVLAERRSFREFTADSISAAELSQLAWAAQGITSDAGKRSAPSAMATYALELYVIVKRVQGIEPGLYRYLPKEHALESVRTGNPAEGFSKAFTQEIAARCAAALVINWNRSMTAEKFGAKAERMAAFEAGHAAQNALLEAQALGLGAVPASGFEDAAVKSWLGTASDPLYIIPVGRK